MFGEVLAIRPFGQGPSSQRARSHFNAEILPVDDWSEVLVAPFCWARYGSQNETLPERCRVKPGMTERGKPGMTGRVMPGLT